jgi:hypothetical protein
VSVATRFVHVGLSWPLLLLFIVAWTVNDCDTFIVPSVAPAGAVIAKAETWSLTASVNVFWACRPES